MEIIRLIEGKNLLFAEKILGFLEHGFSFQEFVTQLKEELDQLGTDLLQVALESLDQQLRESKRRKQMWNVVKRDEPKEILTPFGQLSYRRTYYRHKKTGVYCHLVDAKAGITPHSRISSNMKAELVAACGEASYEQATRQLSRYNPALKVSRQTASNSVKAFQAKPLVPPAEKRRVDNLYIEADEDHLKVRGRRAQARLVYFHEGVAADPRPHLVKARYFTTVQKKPDDFWIEVLDYLEAHYDLENVQNLYLSGDGASWIQTGKEYFPDGVFILDKFHLSKAIISATGHAPELRREINRGIWKGNKQLVMQHLNEALELARTEPRQKRILATATYIENNWEGIRNGIKNPQVGCCAEGHISHILSARLSSRPMAWSQQGAEKMASIRAVLANKESVQEHYLAMCPPAPVISELKKQVRKELKRLKRKCSLGKENLGNVPIYSGGESLTRMALKGLNSITAV